tara:strand:+ start:1807 stop:4062 length:2256 start_codon:yes stop_codon:yes gene_type:complete
MAIKKYFANKDNTITSAFRSNLSTRGTGSNMGLSDILETFSIYGQASSDSTELQRILIEFPVEDIIQDRAAGTIPAGGSVSFYLKMYNAKHSQTTPKELKLVVSPISSSWQEGIGLDMSEYQDVTKNGEGSNWINSSANTPWLREGGDYLSSPVYSQTFSQGDEDLEINITSLVDQWINGSIPNYGVGVHLTSSQEAYYNKYYPRESVQFDTQAFLSGSAQDMELTGPSTFSMWVKPDSIGTTRYMLFWQQELFESFGRVLYANALGELVYNRNYLRPTPPGGNSQASYKTDSTLTAGQWSHIVVVDRADNTTPEIYIDGALDPLSAITPATPDVIGVATNYDMFAIGGSRTGDANNWLGLIDDVAHFDKALTESEVSEIYNSGCPVDIKETSAYSKIQNWWVHGDDPRDAIELGTPPTTISIHDRAGTLNMYATGSGGMSIQEGKCYGQNGTVPVGTDEIINRDGATTSYYTKKFFARGSEFFYKRPVIEARWDSSIKDDRGNVHNESILLPSSDNTNSIYLYNSHDGKLVDIPGAGTGVGAMVVKFYDTEESSDGEITDTTPSTVTADRVSKGIYRASFIINTTASIGYDRWFNSTQTACYHTGSFHINERSAKGHNPYPDYVVSLQNLRSIYYSHETARFRFYIREKDWSPTIYTVATTETDTLTMQSSSYQIHRLIDDMIVVPFDTSTDNSTMMSYDVSGNYFDFDMDILEPGYSYGVKVAFYDDSVESYVEQTPIWKFRVENLESK